MVNTSSLKLNRDFRRLYSKGKSYAGGYIVIYALKNRRDDKRLGLTVGKTFGKAVKRNRIKRLMRESYRSLEDKLPNGYDFICVARTRAEGKSLDRIEKDMEYAFSKLGIIEK